MIIEIECLLNNETDFNILKGTELPKLHRRSKMSTYILQFYMRFVQSVLKKIF